MRTIIVLLLFLQSTALLAQRIEFNIRSVIGFSESFMKETGMTINSETARDYIFDKMNEVDNNPDSTNIFYRTKMIMLCDEYLKKYPEVINPDGSSSMVLSLRRSSIENTKAACYYKRAQIKVDNGDFRGGVDDLSEAILVNRGMESFNNNLCISLSFRGWCFLKLNERDRACKDWREAINLGDTLSIENVKNYCQY
jgi:tetratricopeptide (TPR) repeat protein